MPDHMLFRLRLDDPHGMGPDGSNHIPRQFVMLSVIGVGEVPISICHAPNSDHLPLDQRELHLTIRRVGRVTKALFELDPGDLIGLRGPYFRGFPLTELHEKPLVMIAGGIGMAPLRSLLQYTFQCRKRFGAAVHLLYGARNNRQLLYLDELRDMQQSDRLDFISLVISPLIQTTLCLMGCRSFKAIYWTYWQIHPWTFSKPALLSVVLP